MDLYLMCKKTMSVFIRRCADLRLLIVVTAMACTAGTKAQDSLLSAGSTVEPALQKLAERLLNKKQGSIVAIEPSTGRVLCMASRDKLDSANNRAVSEAYSPGSTFKTAQALTMFAEGQIFENTEYNCHEGFWVDNIHIGCHKHPSPLQLVQAIAQSCNSWFCKAFRDYINNRALYPSKFRAIGTWNKYMRSMGFGQTIALDISGENPGVLPDSAYLEQIHNGRWNGTTVMWNGMGQGEVKTTPLQLCNLAAVIANRGWYVSPHIRLDTEKDSSLLRRHHALPTPQAFDVVARGMRAAVIGGTCASINQQAFRMCGKTGTAENIGEDHSIFIGYAPKEKPTVAVCVYVENAGFGADLAAPLGALIMEQHVMGRLSERSEKHAAQWAGFRVKITPVEIPMSLDDF